MAVNQAESPSLQVEPTYAHGGIPARRAISPIGTYDATIIAAPAS